jgi:hypothetical protein
MLSPICFHLNREGNGNDDISSEEHFENSETIRGSSLDIKVVIFVQIIEFYLVTKSLQDVKNLENITNLVFAELRPLRSTIKLD